jgi:hypothetical protein
MTRQKFLQEVILRLSVPEFITVYAKGKWDNWKLPYDPNVIVDVIARINLEVIEKSPELDKFVKAHELNIDAAALYFYDQSYRKRVHQKFGL